MKEGWKVVELSNIAKSIFAGGDVDKNNLSNTKTIDLPIPIFTNGEKNNGLYGFTNIARVFEPALTISARGTIGFSCIRSEAYFPAVRLISIIPNEKVTLEYLSYFIKNQTVGSSGVSIPQLTVPMVKKFEISLPISLEEQQAIVEKLDFAFEAIEKAKANIEKNIQNAKELFQSKLNEIFSQKGEGWEEKTLDKISKIVNGYAFSSKDFSKDNVVKSVKITNVGVKEFVFDDVNNLPITFLEKNKNVLVNEGDIVMALTRTIIAAGLKVAIVPKEYNLSLLNQRVVAIKESGQLLNQFLYYFLSSTIAKDYVLNHVNTLMQPNLSINDLRNMPIYLPSIKHQEKIVAQFDKLSLQTNLLQEKYKQKLANLEELKKSILKKAFKGELIN